MLKFSGIYPPVATPFTHDGEMNELKLRHNVEKWNGVNLSGYVVCGSTGESVMLTADEKLRMFACVAKYAKAGKQLVCGTGVESVRETVDLTNRAAALGYVAAMVRTPHYYKSLLNNTPAQTGYFRAVADRSRIPIMIYNWPQATGVDIEVEAVARLSEHPNVIAIKESSGSLEKLSALTASVRSGFQVLWGHAPTLFTALRGGAAGGVLAFANAAPYACVTIWEAFRMREEEAGLDWQSRISGPATLVTAKYGIPGLKYAMDLNGYYGGAPRLPLLPVSPAVRVEIETAFDGIRG